MPNLPRGFHPKISGGIENPRVCSQCKINPPGQKGWFQLKADSPDCPATALDQMGYILTYLSEKNSSINYDLEFFLHKQITISKITGCRESHRWTAALDNYIKTVAKVDAIALIGINRLISSLD